MLDLLWATHNGDTVFREMEWKSYHSDQCHMDAYDSYMVCVKSEVWETPNSDTVRYRNSMKNLSQSLCSYGYLSRCKISYEKHFALKYFLYSDVFSVKT